MRFQELYCATRLREGKVVRSTKGGVRDLRFERADYQTSELRLALCLETYSPFMAGHMVRGDFRAPLRCARNDIGEFG